MCQQADKNVKEYTVTVRQFLTKPSNDPRYGDKKPVPFRTMFGYITNETANGVYMKLRAKPEPTSNCMICGREISHPISLLYGIGSDCITKVPFATPLADPNDIDAYLADLKAKMEDIVWEGWLPKGHITYAETGNMIEPFLEKAEEPAKVETQKPEAKKEVERTPIKVEAIKVNQQLVDTLAAELGF